MGIVKRAQPENRAKNFRVKSSLESFNRIIPGTSMREQESSIAIFERKALGEKFPRMERRDDATLGNHPIYGEGFVCLTNKQTCYDIQDLSAAYTGKSTIAPEKRQEFRETVGRYVRSLRELANTCLLHDEPTPLKAQKHFIGDGEELSEIESVMEKKSRLRFKKSTQRKYKAYGVSLRRQHTFATKAVGGYGKTGEAKFTAKIGADGLFLLCLPDGRIASLDYIFKFRPVIVVEFKPRFVTVETAKHVCACMK